MGSRLYLESLDFEESKRICRSNLDFLPDKIFTSCDDRHLTDLSPLWGSFCLEYPPCSSDPRNIWGDLDMLHWAASPGEWQSALTHGNSYSSGSDGAGIVRPRGLLDIQIRGRQLALGEFFFRIAPYSKFIGRLSEMKQDIDLLVFDYDWRLSCTRNAELLAERINARWWTGSTPRNVLPEERTVIIGHSLGGLVARAYIEDPALDGARYTRQLITVGTPHLGAPEIYSNFMGYSRSFSFGLVGESVRRFGDVAVSGNRLLKGALSLIHQRLGNLADSVIPFSQGDLEFLPTHLMPLSVQKAVLGRCASALELMPQDDFVTVGGRLEPVGETIRRLRYIGSGRRPGDVVRTFTERLAAPDQLDCFLIDKGVYYSFFAATGLETSVGVTESTVGVNGENVRAKTGDGVVPERSAALRTHSDSASSIEVQWLGPRQLRGRQHQDLMDVDDVQTACIRRALSSPPKVSKGSATSGAVLARTKELIKVASRQSDAPDKKDFRARAGRKIVVSLVSLRFNDPRYPVLSASLETVDSETYVRGPGFAKWPVQPVGTDRVAYIDTSRESGSRFFGGAVLLPAACTDVLELMTWNVGGGSQSEHLLCQANTHAEAQLASWLNLQKPAWPWVSRIVQIDVVNRSTKTSDSWSPCSTCSRTLRNLLVGIRQQVKGQLTANLSWAENFEAHPKCSHIGDFKAHDWELLERAGWTLPPYRRQPS